MCECVCEKEGETTEKKRECVREIDHQREREREGRGGGGGGGGGGGH